MLKHEMLLVYLDYVDRKLKREFTLEEDCSTLVPKFFPSKSAISKSLAKLRDLKLFGLDAHGYVYHIARKYWAISCEGHDYANKFPCWESLNVSSL